VVCVNDGAVMTAWKKDQGLAGSDLIEFLADTDAELTQAMGIVLTGPDNKTPGAGGKGAGPNKALGWHTMRCKRTATYLVDGVVKVHEVSEGPGPNGEADPAGDNFPENSCIENMLKLISAC
jgi:peroxiredoxin